MKIFILIIFLSLLPNYAICEKIIVDSDMTFESSIAGCNAPDSIIKTLEILTVEYYSFDGKLHRGQLVLKKQESPIIQAAFDLIKKTKFPIAKCIPIVVYNWDDDASMADNNTSMFNYRKIAGKSTLSNHSYGIAIDINPVQNPAVYNTGKISPKGAKYNFKAPGTLTGSDEITLFFKSKGWRWGGDWSSLKDYQHFDSSNK